MSNKRQDLFRIQYLFQVEYGRHLVAPLIKALGTLAFNLPIPVHDLQAKCMTNVKVSRKKTILPTEGWRQKE